MGTDDGALSYLQDLLEITHQKPKNGFRNAPWLTPTVADHNEPLRWICLDRNYTKIHNTSLSFCP